MRGRGLVFWDPQRPGRKLDAIDTDQITPAKDCVSESLDALDEKWKEGAFRYLMPDFRKRVHAGETFVIETAGERVGQVNGLAVMQLGELAFGRPQRITASVTLGSGEVIDIEREVKLGGPLHSKGVLILSGFLRSHYVNDRPLSLSARTFSLYCTSTPKPVSPKLKKLVSQESLP